MKIDTRYYSAEVEICVLSHDSRVVADGTEALILVHDVHRPETFDYLREWSEVLDSLPSPPEVMMCIGTHPAGDDPLDGPITRPECLEWCLDHGMEYLEFRVPDCAVDVEAAKPRPLSQAEGAEGVERVIEALQTHMWPNMVMAGGRDRPGPVPGAEGGGGSSSSDDEDPAGSSGVVGRDGEAPENEGGEGAGAAENAEGSAASVAENLEAGYAPFDRGVVDALLGELGGGDGGEGGMEEDEVEAMSRLMEKMVQLKAQGSNMPDEVRKARAAELALELAKLIGEEDTDDEEDKN